MYIYIYAFLQWSRLVNKVLAGKEEDAGGERSGPCGAEGVFEEG